MGNILIGLPNWIKQESVFDVKFGSGNWESTDPLINLQGKFFFDKAISQGVTLPDTKMDIDLDLQRDTKMVVVTNSNVTKIAKIKIRGAIDPAWTGVVVNGVNSSGATTLNVTEGAATIAVGECFSIAGDTDTNGDLTIYNVTSVAAGVLGIENTFDGAGLLNATVGAEVMTTHSGDFVTGSSLVFDTGLVDYIGKTVEVGVRVWGQPGVWDGKPGDEEFAELGFPKPFIHILTAFEFIQYVRIEIDDTTNAASGIEVDGLYVASAYRPTNNLSFGATVGLKSNTTSENSAGGVEVFNTEESQRFVNGKLENVSISEAWANQFDRQRQFDISDDFFFIFDEDAEELLTRQSFPARYVNLNPLEYNFFNVIDTAIQVLEKLA